MIEINDKKVSVNNVEYNVISFESIDENSFHAITETNIFCFFYPIKIDGIIVNNFSDLQNL
jgi:hypothetical protein